MENKEIEQLIAFHQAGLDQYRQHMSPSSQYLEEQTIKALQELLPADKPADACSEENPCCDRRTESHGFGSGPFSFTCPKHCSCHD